MSQYAHLVLTLSKLNETELKTAENMLMTLKGIQDQTGNGASFSFEIVYHRDFVTLIMSVPKKLKSFVQSQLIGTYPMIEIHTARDFLGSLGKRPLYVGEMKHEESFVFPLKTYVDFDYGEVKKYHDTLAPVLSAFSHLEHPDDLVVLQMAVKSCHRNVARKGIKAITIAQGIHWTLEKPFLSSYTQQAGFHPLWFWIRLLHGFRKGKAVATGQNTKQISSGRHVEQEENARSSAEYEYLRAADKLVKKLFHVNMRVLIATKKDAEHADSIYHSIAASLMSLNDAQAGKIVPTKLQRVANADAFRQRAVTKDGLILNSEELASYVHVPLGELEIPKLTWTTFRKIEPPANVSMKDAVIQIGTSNYHNRKIPFGLKPKDILRHAYIIGRTGMGKSTLLENMLFDAIRAGKGVGVVDPHGDLAEKVLSFVPPSRINDVIVFDPSDTDYPVSYNIMECKNEKERAMIASGLVGVFAKLYADSWGPRLEHILRNTIMTLLWCKDVSILAIPRILTDKKFRKKCVKQVDDPILKDFWEKEYEPLQERTKVEWINPILNKVGQFLSNPILRNILGQVKSKFHIRWAMDKGKILIVNLSKGKIGEDVSTLLGSVLITKFQIEAMSRADIAEDKRRDFYLFIDEFQNFATSSFATILSEARKYKLALIMANQYVAQMDETVRDAIFGNVGTMISFQVGFEDAEDLMKQFSEAVQETDLVSLSRGCVYLRLLVDGLPTPAFSAKTSMPVSVPEDGERVEKILRVSREKYGVKREVIEEKIKKWSGE